MNTRDQRSLVRGQSAKSGHRSLPFPFGSVWFGVIVVTLITLPMLRGQQSKPWETDSRAQVARLQAAAAKAHRTEERDRGLPAGGSRTPVHLRVGDDSRGSREETDAAKTGLVDLYGLAWRTSGAEKMSGDAMDDFLEARAAHIETGAMLIPPQSHGTR